MVKEFSGREEQLVSFNANGVLPRRVLLLALLLLPYALSIIKLYQVVADTFAAYAKSFAEARTQLKICFLTYRVIYFMTDFKYRCKLNRKHCVKYIYTFFQRILKGRFCCGVVVTLLE